MKKLIPILLVLTLLFSGCAQTMPGGISSIPTDSHPTGVITNINQNMPDQDETSDIPEFFGDPYCVLNNNVPDFNTPASAEPFENYSDLDDLGRCGVAYACLGLETMPAAGEKRDSISSVKPSGWKNNDYGDLVDGGYLYNRCHLIGWQLSAENANFKNLITGTRYLNIEGMLPFENMVADYIKETENHVLYRVTPIYNGDDLVAQGVEMEAMSVEDNGASILFDVFCYNVQPGVDIDYATGDNWLTGDKAPSSNSKEEGHSYILNIASKKFHEPNCSGASKIGADNRREYTGSREDLLSQGYEACGICKP